MKSDELLRKTLEETGLPVKPYEYKGTKPEYIVYNEEDERGTSYRDDRPGGTSIWWQAHLFTPIQSDYRSIKRKMREMLLAAVRTLYEKETEIVHVVISCNIVEHMEE